VVRRDELLYRERGERRVAESVAAERLEEPADRLTLRLSRVPQATRDDLRMKTFTSRFPGL
jgi:hypothetical protein